MEVSVDSSELEQLAKDVGANAEKEARRAALGALRRGRTLSRRAMKKQARVETRDRRFDIRRTPSGGQLWVGTDPMPIHRFPNVVSGVGRQTRILGRAVPRVFRPRLEGPVFRRLSKRPYPLEVLDRPLEVRPIAAALDQVPEEYEKEVLKAIDRILQGQGSR